jgi:V/A-type H+-transporting ATPase subunit I
MFFPKAMTELELIVPAKDILPVTKILSGYGVFHQTDSAYPNVATGSANTWQETAALYASLERRIQVVLQTLSIEETEQPSDAFDALADAEKFRGAVEQVEQDVKQTGDQLIAEKKKLEQLEIVLRQLEPVSDLDLDIAAFRNPRYTYSMLGLIPAANVDRLQTSLARVPHVFLTLRSDPQKPVVWLAGAQSNSDVLERAARSAYLDPLSLPEGYAGMPSAIIASLRKSIEETKQKIEELGNILTRYGTEHKSHLLELSAQAHTSRVLSDAIVRYGQLKHTYVVTGWVPVQDLEGLTARLKNASKEILIEALPTTRYGHHSHVPVALTNNKWLKPFQDLITTYGRPSYGEFDPTLLVAFTFPLLYGAMFGDLGQGLLLMLVGVLAHNKIFMKGLQSLGLLFVYCGASAAVFGYLYGSIFGFEGHHIEEYLHFHFEPAWFSPLGNIIGILSIAMDVGIVILISSFLLSLFNNIRSRDWAHFWFGHTGVVALIFYVWFLSFLGGYLGKNPIAPKLAVAIHSVPLPWSVIGGIFAFGVMFSGFFRNVVEGHHPLIEEKGAGGFAMFLLQSFMDLFEASISMLSNTLSFMRLGAFAVAHGGLSLAVFSLAGTEPGLKFWITILLGNIFIILLEGLVVYIQTMRLHYYEIFGKFFHGGGMRFEPLTLTPAKEEA